MFYNGNWIVFRDLIFKSGGIKFVLKVVVVVIGFFFEYIDVVESVYKVYEVYEFGEKLLVFGYVISVIILVVGELDIGSDGLDLGIDFNWRDVGFKVYNVYEVYSFGNEV